MKRIFAAVLMMACLLARGQSQGNNQSNIGGLLIASNFAQWTVPQGNQGGYSWSSPDFCKVSFAGTVFNAFSNGTPVQIVDTGNPTNSEVVTVQRFNSQVNGCSIQVNPTHVHNTFFFRSATGGLGEAMAFAGQQLYQVILTPDWTKLGGNTGLVTSQSGNANVTIMDQRTAVLIPYIWSGSAYVAQPFTSSGPPTGPASGCLSGVYPNPGLATTCAIPSAWTATTAALNDNTTLLATTAFVQANKGGGAVFPGSNGVVFNTSTSASRNATSGDLNTIYGYTPLAPSYFGTLPGCSTAGNLFSPAGTNCVAPSGSPGGADTQVQFNNAGVFAGDSGLTFNNSTKTLIENNNTISPLGTAVSGTNFSSGTMALNASYFSGSALTDGWSLQSILSGTVGNPVSQLTISHSSASTGGAQLLVQAPVIAPSVSTSGSGSGVIGISGSTSGTVTQTVSAVAGTPTVTWGNGSGTPAVTASSPLAIDATTGNISVTSGLLPSAPGYGYAPISTGAGTAYAAQAPILQFGANNTQYVQGPFSPTLFSTLAPNSVNKWVDVEGFSNSGIYSGVGTAATAWVSGPDYGFCQVVSSGGTDWISVQKTGSGTTTPGTNVSIWLPFPNFQAANKLDCAWYLGQAYKRVNHASIGLQLGAATYNTGGLVDLVDGNSFDDQFTEGIFGSGISGSIINYTGSAAVPVIQRPAGAGNFASWTIQNVTINGGGTASADIEADNLGPSLFSNISAGHILPGTTNHAIQIAHAGGFGFQVAMEHINVGIFPDSNTPNCAVVTPTVVAGSVTAWTVNTAGTCYHAASATNVYHVQLRTRNGAAADGGCTTYPAGQTITLSGSGIASIAGGTGGTGCGAGPFYVQVYSTTPVAYGLVLNQSDSHLSDITSYLGDIAAIQLNAGNVTAEHLHPSVTPGGVQTNVSGSLTGTEIDDVFDKGFVFNQPFTTTGMAITGTNGYVGCGGTSRLNVGSTTYYFSAATTNVNIGTSSSLFDSGGANSSCNAGWQEFVGQSGPIQTPADFATKAPIGFSETGNDKSLAQPLALGDYIPLLTTGVFNVGGAGAASASPVNVTGAPFAGTGTTSTPLVYINGGAAPTTWNTGGTLLGINTPPSFAGRAISLHNNGGAELFGVNGFTGSVVANNVVANGTVTSGGSILATTNGTLNLQTANTTAATSGACVVSGAIQMIGTYWNGSASATDTIGFTPTCGGGTNGTETLTVGNSGSSGAFTFGITGALTANSVAAGGLVSATTGSITALTAGSIAVGGDSTFNAAPRAFLSASTGPLAVIVANGQYSPAKIVKSGTIENIEGTASAFTCTVNPTLTLEDCGTSAGTCASPTALASVTLAAANTITDGSITSATITAGHYVAWETTAGTCTSVGLSASAEYRMN